MATVPRQRNPRVQAFVDHFGGRYQNPEVVMRLVVAAELRRAKLVGGPPPIRPDAFRQRFGIKDIREDASLPSTAALLPEGDGYVIAVKPSASSGRKNFSCFHEIAHIFFIEAAQQRLGALRREERAAIRSTQEDEERLCDVGGREFLLPARLFKKMIDAFPVSWDSIRNVARTFDASLDATVARYDELATASLLVDRWTLDEAAWWCQTIVAAGHLVARANRKRRLLNPPKHITRALEDGHSSVVVRMFVQGVERRFTVDSIRRARGPSMEVLSLIVPTDMG